MYSRFHGYTVIMTSRQKTSISTALEKDRKLWAGQQPPGHPSPAPTEAWEVLDLLWASVSSSVQWQTQAPTCDRDALHLVHRNHCLTYWETDALSTHLGVTRSRPEL